MGLEIPVKLGSSKQDADAKIEPQHHEDDSGQASVGDGIIAKIPEINGKDNGKGSPADGRKDGSGKLGADGEPFKRQHGIDCRKKDDQDRNGEQTAPGRDQEAEARQAGKKEKEFFLQHAAKDEERQADDAHDGKQYRVGTADHTPQDIVSPGRDAVDAV